MILVIDQFFDNEYINIYRISWNHYTPGKEKFMYSFSYILFIQHQHKYLFIAGSQCEITPHPQG